MVRVAIAGGSGQLAHHIIDALLERKKHEIIVLSRRDPNPGEVIEGTTWVKVDYNDKANLVKALDGVHTLLSFVLSFKDEGGVASKLLIDAAVEAGVKRFAPNEWSTNATTHLHWYATKHVIRDYLKEINKDKKVLEYTLFQPGLFMNYFTHPYKTSPYMSHITMPVDFESRQATLVADTEARITLTEIHDIARVVARAIEYEGEWPVTGGIQGNSILLSDLVALGEKLRGQPFKVSHLKKEDLMAGELKDEWMTSMVSSHPSLSEEDQRDFARRGAIAFVLSFGDSVWNVSDEWNKLLPDFEFVKYDKFLADVWVGKP